MCTALLWVVARPGMASSSRSRHKKATRDTGCTAVITELVQGRRFIMAHPTQHRGWIDGANLRMAIASMAVAILIITASHIAVAQTFTALHGFNGMPDGATPIGGLTMDRAGNFYGRHSSKHRTPAISMTWHQARLATFR